MSLILLLARAGVLGLLALTAPGSYAQTPAFSPGEEKPEDLADGPGREETFFACTACHNFRLVAAQAQTRSQWDETLTWMHERHKMADVQGSDRDLILDYLAKHYGPRAPSSAGAFKNPFAAQ